uniref:SOWAHA-C winged helix-turn-helix domain-containing protein n=1 Tax=Oncorhynchus tshawytscha TaxID=74940 RepID=A0A8C8F457_ONCTS
MATDFTQDSVLYFLRCNGGRVKNSELLAHFNAFIKDQKNQTHNRELFKKFINSVAVVKTEEGVRYVVLRKTFLGASAATGWPLLTTLEHASSFPCLSDPSAAPLTPDPQVTRGNGNLDGNLHLHHSIPQQPRPKEDGVPDPVPIPDIHSQYPEESRAAVPQSWVKPQPPQCHLPLDSPYHTPTADNLRGEMRSGASSNKSLNSGHDSSYFHRHNLVPLEPKEHDWLVKGAAGLWADIYTLFRDEPSLLTNRDFITGYTILHWIAKHGDHRVLNTLWYGVNKAGFKLDVDVKTTCGYTPLHLAAIHGNDKMIRLLVHKFSANVALRDTSGKKAWQHLSRTGPIYLLEMLGAPQCLTSTEGSSSSQSTGERPTRPVTSSGSATVKRSTSIAVFLNKTLMKFPGRERSQSSDSLV